jgi:hypothetical protein
MLFTDASWAETSATRRAIAKPYQPWRCVGWTEDEVCFWVFPKHDAAEASDLPDGLMVVGPEALIEVIAQMPADAYSVHAFQSGSESRAVGLVAVTGLFSQPSASAKVQQYWFRTEKGALCACSSVQSSARDDVPLNLIFEQHKRDFCTA